MRRGILLPALLITLGCSNIASPLITSSETYEYRDLTFGDTLTFHWPRSGLPVRVWVAPDSPIRPYVVTAIDRWEHAFLYGEFSASLVADSGTADIIVQNKPSDVGGTQLRTSLQARSGECDGETVIDLNRDARTLQLPIHLFMYAIVSESQPGIPACFSITMTHEFGHAIGILVHSPNVGDVMYANPGFDGISDRDRLTAEVLYQTPPTVTIVGRR